MVLSGRSVNLTTFVLGRLRPPKRLTSISYFVHILSPAFHLPPHLAGGGGGGGVGRCDGDG